ncbi:MAG: hypothetical protein FWG51_02260, partial [Firmicutes bacterium]|nr:hypothetical protein [Bacillota bacterium]
MINVFYCTDNKFFKQQVISLISLAKTTKEPLNVINLTAELIDYNQKGRKTSKEQDALCTKILQESNSKSVFRSIDVSDLMREHLMKGPNLYIKYYKFSAYLS